MHMLEHATAQARKRNAKPRRRCTCGGCTCCAPVRLSQHRGWRIAVQTFYQEAVAGNHYLVDDAMGRAVLMVLLALGMPVDDVGFVAPWMRPQALRSIRKLLRASING